MLNFISVVAENYLNVLFWWKRSFANFHETDLIQGQHQLTSFCHLLAIGWQSAAISPSSPSRRPDHRHHHLVGPITISSNARPNERVCISISECFPMSVAEGCPRSAARSRHQSTSTSCFLARREAEGGSVRARWVYAGFMRSAMSSPNNLRTALPQETAISKSVAIYSRITSHHHLVGRITISSAPTNLRAASPQGTAAAILQQVNGNLRPDHCSQFSSSCNRIRSKPWQIHEADLHYAKENTSDCDKEAGWPLDQSGDNEGET